MCLVSEVGVANKCTLHLLVFNHWISSQLNVTARLWGIKLCLYLQLHNFVDAKSAD